MSDLIAAILFRQLTLLSIRIRCMQPIRPSRFSSFGSQFAIPTCQQWSANLTLALSMNVAAALMLYQVTLMRESLNMALACVVSYNFVV